jgi:hypothetical protein
MNWYTSICRTILVLFFSEFLLCAFGDEGVYRDTIGAIDGTIHLNLAVHKDVQMSVLVSGNGFAGSKNIINATFIGDFSSSGPSPIGPFNTPGAQFEITVPLQREIGNLKSIWMENKGHDSLLLSQLRCRINSQVYELQIPEKWMHTFDPSLITADNSNGFTPKADISLPSSSTLLFPVVNEYIDYNSQGVNTSN